MPARSTCSRASGTTWTPAGLRQGVQHRRGRPLRRQRRAVGRRLDAGGRRLRRGQHRDRHRRQPGRQLRRRTPARSTCSRAAARPGPSRRTSRRPTPARATIFGIRRRAVGRRLHPGGRRVRRGQRRDRHRRQPGRQLRRGRRRGLRVHARRHDVDASRPTSRRPTPARATTSATASRCRATARRSRWARMHEDSAATGIDGNQADNVRRRTPARSTCSRAAARRGPSRPTSRRPTPTPTDCFGFSVALSGDGSTLAVGAYREDSAATGIDGNQADNSAADAGAVYVFTRSGTTWTQQAYVKASNTGASDCFGASRRAVGRRLDARGRRHVRGQRGDRHRRQPGRQLRRQRRRGLRPALSAPANASKKQTNRRSVLSPSVP